MTESPLNVLFVGHEASRTGAPVGFLSLMRWFKDQRMADPLIWLRHGGPLTEAHEAIGPLAVGAEGKWQPADNRSIHLAYLNTATLGAFAEVLATKGIPVICHVHEMEYGLRVTGARNLRQLHQHVTRFIACSCAVRDALIRVLGIEESKITVVPECVDVTRALRMAQEGSMTTEGKAAGVRTLAGMGTVNWRKGTDLFLRVLAHLNRHSGERWQGLWIGDLESAPDRDQLRHDIRVLGITDQMHFTGSLANPFPQLASADVYCLTSREDPYPLAMVEAAALGKPIVGFRGSGGVEEFAAEAGGILVDYADTSAMADAARACLASPPQHGREAAERLCSPDVVGAAIARLMHAVSASVPVKLDADLMTSLQKASLPAVHTKVRLLSSEAGGHEYRQGECELTQDGKVLLVESWPYENGGPVSSFVISIEPQERSIVLQDFQVRLQAASAAASQALRIKIRTGGRALICNDTSPKAWLCVDGKGRLMLELRLPEEHTTAEALEVTATWEQSLQIKEVLTPLLKLQSHSTIKTQGGFARWWRILQGKE